MKWLAAIIGAGVLAIAADEIVSRTIIYTNCRITVDANTTIADVDGAWTLRWTNLAFLATNTTW